jgi:hypothetical protein
MVFPAVDRASEAYTVLPLKPERERVRSPMRRIKKLTGALPMDVG